MVLDGDDAEQAQTLEWFEELNARRSRNQRSAPSSPYSWLVHPTHPKVQTLFVTLIVASDRCQLEALTEEQTAQYLRYRLSVAGCRDEIFTPDAVSAIHQATQGIPRQINDLGDSAMMWARLHQARPVDAEVVQPSS